MVKRKITKKKSSTKKSTVKRKVVAKKPAKRVVRKTVTRKSVAKKPARSSVSKIRIPTVNIKPRWNSYALAYSIAILMALEVLIVSVGNMFANWSGMVEMMEKVYFSYSTTITGTIAGMAEAAIWGLVFGFIWGWLYNKFN